MCTVVCRWFPELDVPVQILALRDELVSRDFDTPDAWWTDLPGVVGGRDRLGGGTWCATDVSRAATAVVLNRPERRVAKPGAASRGMLPLLALGSLATGSPRSAPSVSTTGSVDGAKPEPGWASRIDLGPMASFNLLLATPASATWWSYDGDELLSHSLEPGTHMFTPKGISVPLPDDRFERSGAALQGAAELREESHRRVEEIWPGWMSIIAGLEPSTDPMDLLVRAPYGDDFFATVFGQFIASRPGWLRLDHSRSPGDPGSWSTRHWQL